MTFAIDVAAVGGVDVSAARSGGTISITDKDIKMIGDAIDEWSPSKGQSIGAWWYDIDIDKQKQEAKGTIGKKAGGAMEKMQIPTLQVEALRRVFKKISHAPFSFDGFPTKDLSGE